MHADVRLVKTACSGLGLGCLPVAPGTWASAGAAGVYLAVRCLPEPHWRVVLGVLFLAVLILGLTVGRHAAEVYGSKDPGRFVLDEVAGMWLTCLGFWWRGALATAIAAFVVFRVLDIAKPLPLRRLERLPGGWGIMADDLAAALYSLVLLWPLCYGILDRFLGA